MSTDTAVPVTKLSPALREVIEELQLRAQHVHGLIQMATEALRDDVSCNVEDPEMALAGITELANRLMMDLDADAIGQRAAELVEAAVRRKANEEAIEEYRREVTRELEKGAQP